MQKRHSREDLADTGRVGEGRAWRVRARECSACLIELAGCLQRRGIQLDPARARLEGQGLFLEGGWSVAAATIELLLEREAELALLQSADGRSLAEAIATLTQVLE